METNRRQGHTYIRTGLGIPAKMSIFVVVVSSIIVGALVYLTATRLESAINAAYRDKAVSMIQALDALVFGPEALQTGTTFQEHIDKLTGLNPSIYKISVYAPQGDKVIRIASSNRAQIGEVAEPHDAEPIYSNETLFFDKIKEGEEMVEVLAPLHLNGKPVASVGVYLRLLPRDMLIAEHRDVMIVAGVVGLVLLLVLLMYFVRRIILWPLGALVAATEDVAQGQFGRTVDLKTGDEMERLSDAFNRMSLSLQDWQDRNARLRQELEEKFEEAREMAITDATTGLYNHRYFQEQLVKEIQRAERFRHPVALLFCDIDNFKVVNDTMGHQYGDEVLHRLGGIFNASVRKIDLAARYGGEEFTIILPETDAEGAVQLAERLCRMVSASSIGDPREQPITISIGVAIFPDDATTREELINAADRAMYLAKERGRNQVRLSQKLSEETGHRHW